MGAVEEDSVVLVPKRGVVTLGQLKDATIKACVESLGDDAPAGWQSGRRASVLLQFWDASACCFLTVREESFERVRHAKRLLAIPVPANG